MLKLGDMAPDGCREVRVIGRTRDLSINVYHAAPGGRVEIKGVNLPNDGWPSARALAALNSTLPAYVAPVSQEEVDGQV